MGKLSLMKYSQNKNIQYIELVFLFNSFIYAYAKILICGIAISISACNNNSSRHFSRIGLWKSGYLVSDQEELVTDSLVTASLLCLV